MRIMRYACAFVCALAAFGQQSIVSEDLPPNIGVQRLLAYTGTNLDYQCIARSVDSNRARSSTAIASATNANPVVFTVSGGHGFDATMRPKVVISGGTGSWTAVNLTATATVLSSTTFSIAVNSTAFGAVAGSLVFTTTAPRTNAAEWSVQRFFYDAAGNLTSVAWDNGSPTAYSSNCASSTTSNLQ